MAFNGYCLVLVQANKQAGEIKLKASSETLKGFEIRIDCVRMNKSNDVIKKLLFGIIISSINFLYAQSIPDWENPDINGINKENPHAYSFLCEQKASNPTVKSLNGIWKFKWSHITLGLL